MGRVPKHLSVPGSGRGSETVAVGENREKSFRLRGSRSSCLLSCATIQLLSSHVSYQSEPLLVIHKPKDLAAVAVGHSFAGLQIFACLHGRKFPARQLCRSVDAGFECVSELWPKKAKAGPQRNRCQPGEVPVLRIPCYSPVASKWTKAMSEARKRNLRGRLSLKKALMVGAAQELLECAGCGCQTSVTAGTIFCDSLRRV